MFSFFEISNETFSSAQDRKCFAFPVPTSQEEMGQIDKLSDGKLNEEFLKTVEDFQRMIFEKGKVKSSGNVVLNGDCEYGTHNDVCLGKMFFC